MGKCCQPQKSVLTGFSISCIAWVMTSWIKDFVEDLPLASNGQLRMDCPSCAKKNTFSVSEVNGERLWYCFHADCGVRGRTGFRIRKDTPCHPLLKKQATPATPDVPFVVPDTFVSLSRSPEAEAYVRRVNAYEAYRNGLADIRYDFRTNRVAYLIKHNNRIVDAAGRSLDSTVKPKWWRYGKSGNPFICGGGRIAAILEDCASACSVCNILSGIALLGTSLPDSYIPTLRTYDRLVVALDKDATKKALDLVRRLQAIRPTSLVILDKDVKDMNDDERQRTFERYLS